MNKFTLVLPLLFLSNSIFAAIISNDDAEDLLRDTITNIPACIVLKELNELPFTLDPDSRVTEDTKKLMEAFTKVGLLSKETGKKKMMKNLGFSKRMIKINTFTYSMTDLGKDYYKEDAIQISKNSGKKPLKGSGFCYADKIKITGITKNRDGYLEYYILVPSKAEWATNKVIEDTGLVADKSWGNFRTFTRKGQVIPEGLKVKASVKKLKNGDFTLMYY